MGVLCTTTTTTNNNHNSGNNSSDLNIKNDVFSRIHRHLNYNAENVNLNKSKSSITTPSLSPEMPGFIQHQIAEINNNTNNNNIIRLGMHLSNSAKFSDANCMDGSVNSCTNSYRFNLRQNSINIHSMPTNDSNRNGFNNNGNHQQQQQQQHNNNNNNNVVNSDPQRIFPSKTSAPDLSLG